jgi:ABC-type antimicrobial peptide transport system permease subunit
VLLLFGAVALLWATAVANITGLMLVQVQRRARELAIRTALGASRARAIGSIAREILLIALTGAAGGTIGAWLMVRSTPALLATTPGSTNWRSTADQGRRQLARSAAESVTRPADHTRRAEPPIASGA